MSFDDFLGSTMARTPQWFVEHLPLGFSVSINLLILFIISVSFPVASFECFLISATTHFLSASLFAGNFVVGVFMATRCTHTHSPGTKQKEERQAIFINIHKLKCSRKVFGILIIDGTHSDSAGPLQQPHVSVPGRCVLCSCVCDRNKRPPKIYELIFCTLNTQWK